MELSKPTNRLGVVRSRAPLRLGLAGGGTDLASYCDEFGGAVLNLAINRFAYAFIELREDSKLCLRSSDLGIVEELDSTKEISLDHGLMLQRGVYRHIINNFNDGKHIPMTLQTFVDVPMGSGLGASSAIVVALIEAFRKLLDLAMGRYDVARLAYKIEREELNLAGGRQDHYAATFGGVNFIEFSSQGNTIVNPLLMSSGDIDELETSLVICFTGNARQSATIITEQAKRVTESRADTLAGMHQLKMDAFAMKTALLSGNIERMAEIMRRSWIAKKSTANSISNSDIDGLFDFAMSNGAIAGKISGAGGGGFMMFMVKPEQRPDFVEALRKRNMVAEPVHFSFKGCESWIPR